MKQENKKTNEKYKLYKSVREVLHPTISKKNISNYEIILDEKILPIRIYYPNKVTNLDKAIIFIEGYSKINNIDNNYSKLLSSLSKELDKLIISIDYDENKSIDEQKNEIYSCYEYIYHGLITNGFNGNDITLVGDSTGASLILGILDRIEKNAINDSKVVLFYPVLMGNHINNNTSPLDYDIFKNIKNYYIDLIGKKTIDNEDILGYEFKDFKNYPETLIICGNVDPLVDDIKDLAGRNNIDIKIISFASHDFLNGTDKEIKKEYKKYLTEFI